MNREQVQSEALQALINNSGGTCVLSTGTGKSKVAIDYIKHSNSKSILITSPRTNLKENWKKELEKWGVRHIDQIISNFGVYSCGNGMINITTENIQTCYKWTKEQLQKYDLIIADEIHTMTTPEYGQLLINAKELNITTIGLTGTPDDRKKDKFLFYQKYCPIVYRYLNSAKDGIVNKRKYIVFEYELDDNFQIEVKTKFKSWKSGEKKQYLYAQSQIDKGELLIREELSVPYKKELKVLWKDRNFSNLIKNKVRNAIAQLKNLKNLEYYVNYFGYAKSWYFGKLSTKEKKHAGGVYMRGITARQELLWNLNSTAALAKKMSEIIQETYKDSKVLIFSSRTEQANKISPCSVHSKNVVDDNETYLSQFNQGNIRQLGSCYSLTLGLNLKDAGFAIMESYNSSDVQFKQRAGRTDRLPVDEDAIVTFIIVKNTQGEKWFNNSVTFDEDDEVKTVKSLKEFKEALLELKPI